MFDKLSLLYVEDTPGDLDLTIRHFRKNAPYFTVNPAGNLNEAKKLLKNRGFDIVLIDYKLPDGDGISLLQWMQGNGISIPTVMITGYGDTKTAVHALRAGVDDYLPKRPGYLDALPALLDKAASRFSGKMSICDHPFAVLYGETCKSRYREVNNYFTDHAPHITLRTFPLWKNPIALPENKNFDAIVMEYQSPAMRGLETFKGLTTEYPNLPVVILARMMDEDMVARFFKLGASDLILKEPGYLARLRNALERVVDHSRLRKNEKRLVSEIKERKLKEKELKDGRSRYKRLVEGTPGILYSFSDKRGGIFYSPRVEPILGYTPSQLYENPSIWHDAIHPDDVGTVDRASGAAKAGKDFAVDYRIRDAFGSWHWFHDRSIGILAGEDETIVEGLAVDFTEKKKEKDERAELERQLRQTQKMEAIGVLAGGIAHDFNNILGAIIGFGELAQMSNPLKDHKIDSYLKEVLNGAHRAKNLVYQILAFSRRKELEKVPIQLAPILRESLKLMRATLPSTVCIRQHISKFEGLVFGDPGQMHQIIMNLCTNAAYAMRREGGELAVSLDEPGENEVPSDLSAGAYIRLSVKDTGCGIPPDLSARIFEPYFTTKENGDGTGMGLSVVHGIVKSHRGAIDVESEPGNGSVFHVYLPIDKGEPVDQRDRPALSMLKGSGRILFVDDERPLVEFGKTCLEELGYEVFPETDSSEALDIFRDQPDKIDLVISDLTMPVMTGIELAKNIFRIRPDLPIILCTGFSETITDEVVKASGVREFIQKPITACLLSETVYRFLGTNGNV